ncbi:hypothetical protein BJ875DRAFT_117587 [Amylocarpus encephaloides]|uniref:BIR-domain-containing protein n=1 Tax=Amylocarpus encephaloides TaxID=45428 RepID=A0A9P8C2G8_9HELO|nr:hypothetical protein BJ875DRAFT_117587 [Amylocarpus encephaloides]
MALKDVADQYFTFEERLASFQTAQPVAGRRASKANAKTSRTKKWSHKTPQPEDLAKAGFFFYPKQDADDNTICFLCHANIDGWAKDDNPLVEHVNLSPDCAWAVLAMIEAEHEEKERFNSLEDPTSERMIKAREATFAGRWPHDSKKGWKCKTKQMVAAGWKYTPTNESDDMATCSYCGLGLDGWDPTDKPREQHLKRAKDCLYFQLVKKNKSSKRASVASRVSIQSSATFRSEAPSFLDATADEGDSVLTTATSATMKKAAKAKKVPARGRATRAKKPEPVEVMSDAEPEPTEVETKVKAPPKATKGRKRKSEEIEESIPTITDAGPPPAKRRTTRTRGSVAPDNDVPMADDGSSRLASHPSGKKKRGSTRSTRKTYNASKVPLSRDYVNDDELDAALEADLERPLSDDEVQPVTRILPPPKKSSKSELPPYTDHVMFGLGPAQNDEAALDAELDAMEIDHIEVSPKPLPKAKGAKGKQPRKASAKQQAAAKKAAEAQAAAEAEAEAEQFSEEPSLQIVAELEQSALKQHSSPIVQPKRQKASIRQPARKPSGRATRGSVISINSGPSAPVNSQKDDFGNETDGSIASETTVVRGGSSRRASSTRTGKGGKKAASRHVEEIIHKTREGAQSRELDGSVPSAAKGNRTVDLEEDRVTEEIFYTPAPESMEVDGPLSEHMSNNIPEPRMANRETQEPTNDKMIPSEGLEALTPRINMTKTTKAKAGMESPRRITPPPKDETPSQSPQSSDAENHPPSSKPSAATKKVSTPHSVIRRVPLGAMTPIASPSKRNIISGLQTIHPWTEDLDTIFLKSPGGKNVIVNSKELFSDELAKAGTLTSPEKRMTVEEWIKYNAEMAEIKLKAECERMVSSFETQGTRAMMTLEGIECLEQ